MCDLGKVPDLPGQLFAHLQCKVNCACPCVSGENEWDVIQNTQDGAGHEETLDSLLLLLSFLPLPSSHLPSSSPLSNRCRPAEPNTPLKCCLSISHVTFLSTLLPPHSRSSQFSKFSQALDPFLWLSGQHFFCLFWSLLTIQSLTLPCCCTKLFLDYFLLVPFLSGKTMPDSEEPMINNSAWDRFFPPPTDNIHHTQPGYRSIPGKLTLRSQWSLCSVLGGSLSRGVPWNTGEPVSPPEMVISKSSLIAPSFLPRPSVPGILSPPTQKDKDWVIWFVWDCDDFKVGNPSSAPSVSLRHARVAGPHIDHSDNSFFFWGGKKKALLTTSK